MHTSVIIPTFRRPDDLVRCLEALRRQDCAPDEVLVAVRADDELTGHRLARWATGPLPLRLVPVGLANASEARNECVDRSAGEILVFLDDDTAPFTDFIGRIQQRFRDDAGLGGVGGPDWIGGQVVAPAARAGQVGGLRWWGRWIGNHHRGTGAPMLVRWLKGANMSFRREALMLTRFGRDLRGSGAQFGEDLAVSLTVSRAGWRLLYDPAIAVNHYPGALATGRDHRALTDRTSLADAAHNDTVLLLGQLPPLGRVVALIYAFTVGTRLLPGLVVGVHRLVTGRTLDGLRRCAVVTRGRIDGWRTWRRSARPSGVAMTPRADYHQASA